MKDSQQCLSMISEGHFDISKWQELVDLVAELFGSDSGTIVQLNQDEFRVLVTSGNKDNFLKQGDAWPREVQSFCKHAVETKQGLYVENALVDDVWKNAPVVVQESVRSYCGLPIFWPNGDVFGTICMIDKHVTDYDEKLHRLLNQMCRLVAADLKHLCNLDEIRSLALVDELTELLNRRGFKLLGEQKIKDAPRYQQAMGMLYIDVNRMKMVNDQYGHQAGDECLKTLADVLQKECRDNDVVARLGGDEFVVLSLLSNRRELGLLAQRITDFYAHQTQGVDHLSLTSLSIGQTINDCFSNISLDQLIAESDESMYEVKRKSRQ
ncbi:sensor domain-containing diguanylate cyclase [Vibrio paucivorans]|uniref:Sensor domain-containing diguanylate cyclase n=1 Tax=Vibrio paucivorans TaxID=2829489 RepID=A0A9X3CGH3_9VIBR|nr:sensor domain-containing diguanylate cyclase [Vibrio paucivorans]MCW8335009.1 sensor domain-containing diguanylate cyclase [Vibrio paucivorans]